MKIMLMAVNAKYIHSNLAVYDLRAYAHQYRDFISIKEYTINQKKAEIIRSIYREAPDIICVSCYIWNISFICEIIRDLKKILPDTVIWAGGPEVSYDAGQFLNREPDFTGVMSGEGEETFRLLCRYYVHLFCGRDEPVFPEEAESGTCGSLKEIPGIYYRGDGEIHYTGPAIKVPMDSVPFVYEELSEFANRIIYYESSRGCPFSCSYCLSSIDKSVRFRSMNLVLSELQFFLDRKVPQVKFVDRTFNCSHGRCRAIWKYLRDHDNGITNFHFEIGADLLDEEELRLLGTMRPGLVQLEIGVQSTNHKTLEEIRRQADFHKIRHAVETIRSFGNIHQHLDLIAGLPYENYPRFRESFNEVYSLKPDQLQLGFLKVLKGSAMAEKQREYHLITSEKEPYEVMANAWMSFEELLRLKSVEEMVEVYYNSGQFQETLKACIGCFTDAFSFYEQLGAYYEQKHLDSVPAARIRRYEILLAFLLEHTDLSPDLIKDSLVKDLYLREKLKSRPVFALDQKPFEEEIWNFRRRCSVSKTAHVEAMRSGSFLLFDYEHRDFRTGNAWMTDISEMIAAKAADRRVL